MDAYRLIHRWTYEEQKHVPSQRTIAQVIAVATLVFMIAIPHRSTVRQCPGPLADIPYTLRGIGIEEKTKWALFSLKNSRQEEELVEPGEVLEGCFTVIDITNNSATLRSKQNEELRTFYLSGHSMKGRDPTRHGDSNGFM